MTELPFTLPVIEVSATHHCKPYAANAFEIVASINGKAIKKALQGEKGPGIKTKKRFKVTVAMPDAADDDEALADAVKALNKGMADNGVDANAGKVYRSVDMTLVIDNMDYGTWEALKEPLEKAVSKKLEVSRAKVRADGYPAKAGVLVKIRVVYSTGFEVGGRRCGD